MRKKVRRPKVVLDLPDHVPDVIKAVDASTTAMKLNAQTFSSLAALIAKTETDNQKLAVLETATKTGTRGAADARDEQLIVVKVDMTQVQAGVQQQVDLNPAQAETIAAQAALRLSRSAARGPRVFTVRAGKVSGSIEVEWPRAARNAAYNVQISLDGGKTWSEPLTTDLARASFSGLPVGATVLVRYRATRKGVTGDWSEPTSFLVR